ncbi:uncharacterized protein LOC130805809 [Amaranthus tricolor]|uniref:uncharacterized protein LOC130805809 n=1 Tax=Amaranthus tricolor TaxID=29722 RepID=UPI00258CCC6C|nr:uncharacterized protein LOC130805809 [Amaranthus tricolor]
MKFSIDRNHMFLICNGILVILVKSSSSKNKSSSNSGYSAHGNYDHNAQFSDVKSVESEVYVHDHKLMDSECDHVYVDHDVDVDHDLDHDVDVKNDGLSIVKVDVTSVESKVHHVHHHKIDVHVDHDHDHVYVDHDVDVKNVGLSIVKVNVTSVEKELNKRCEDFIRRMKQGIRSESRKDKYVVGFS